MSFKKKKSKLTHAEDCFPRIDLFDDDLKKELDERLERLETGASKTFPWKEIKKRLLKK